MADTAVPFALGAANVPLVEDLNDIPVGQAVQIDVLVADLDDGDSLTSMTVAIKRAASDSDLALTTLIKTITPTLSAAGVIVETDDATVRRGLFALTRAEGIRLSRTTTNVYSITATVVRDGVTYTRMVQRGALSVNLYPIDNESPLADGSYFADGELYASGFDT